jgi:hypothetical protein
MREEWKAGNVLELTRRFQPVRVGGGRVYEGAVTATGAGNELPRRRGQTGLIGDMSEPTTTAQEISDLVRHLGVALSNVETFSADHPLAEKQIATAYAHLTGLLHRYNKPLVITVADKRIVFDRARLEDRSPVVAKFAVHLEEIQANHLTFDPGLTAAELEEFYRVLGKDPKFINAQGGFAALLAAAQVTHVKVRRLDFMAVGRDEKIVNKTAVVIESPAGKEHAADVATTQHVLKKMVERIDEQKWLLHEMKNNPQRAADLFVEGINLVASKMEAGMTPQSAGSETLIKSIQLLGDALVTGESSTPPEDREDLEKFIMILEKEVRQCSVRLMSSKVAAGLLTEILGVVTSYTDQVRARKIADEFVRGGKSLEKVGRLVRHLTPAAESTEDFLSRIRKHLLQHGLTEADLARLEEAVKMERKPKPRPKPYKHSSEAIAQGIAERLQDLNLEAALLEEIIARLCRFIEDRAREKAGELRLDVEKLHGRVARCENVLRNLPVGVVLWNADGKVEFLSHAATQTLGTETGVDLSATLKARLRERSFPLTTPAPPSPDLSAAEMQLLRLVSLVFGSETGDVYGVLLNVGPSGSTCP